MLYILRREEISVSTSDASTCQSLSRSSPKTFPPLRTPRAPRVPPSPTSNSKTSGAGAGNQLRLRQHAPPEPRRSQDARERVRFQGKQPGYSGMVFVSGDFACDAVVTITDESRGFRSAQEDERAQAVGLTDADTGIAMGVAEMEHDDDLEVEEASRFFPRLRRAKARHRVSKRSFVRPTRIRRPTSALCSNHTGISINFI